MATITFSGPTVEDPNVTVTKTVTLPDATFIEIQQAICTLNGYVSGPRADFVVQRAVLNWRAMALSFAKSQAEASAAPGIASSIATVQSGLDQIVIS